MHVVLLVSASFVASGVGFEDLVILGHQAQYQEGSLPSASPAYSL